MIRTSEYYRPAFKLKDVNKLNGWEWTSWKNLKCVRLENTVNGKWDWVGDSVGWAHEPAFNPDDSFPELEDIAVVTCREYAICDDFWKYNWPPKDHLISTTCENLNGFEDNCDRINFHCPKGLKPNVEYVTCERIQTTKENVFTKLSGEWKFPEITQTHEDITCKEDNNFIDENSITITEPILESTSESKTTPGPEINLCEDLNDHYFDETVDVSFQSYSIVFSNLEFPNVTFEMYY